MRLRKIPWQFITLLSILILASYLRLYKISEYMTFLGDEGRDALVVKRMIVDHKWTLLGPTASVGGFFLGPIYYYFMLPFLWLWRLDPTGPAVMVALFGIATVYLVYKVGKAFFNVKAAFFAASLYALSPLVIAYSRSSWNPNLVPFFSLFLIYCLWKAIKADKLLWYLFVGFSIGIGLQLHYLFSFLIIVSLIYILLFARSLNKWKQYTSAILGFLLGFAPFLLFEFRHGFPNTQTIIKFIFAGEETGLETRGAIRVVSDIAFRLFARLVFLFPPSEQFYKYSKNLLILWRFFILASIISSLVLLIYQIIKKRNRQRQYVLLLIWIVVSSGLFIFYKKAIYDYYLGIMFPLPFLLLGHLFAFFYSSKLTRFFAVFGFIALVALNWYGRPFKYEPNRQLEQVKKISKFVFEKAENKPFNFALITSNNSDHAYRYFFEIWDNKPLIIENLDNDPKRKTVTGQLLVICESLPCKPLGHPLWEIAGFGQAEIAGDWEVSFVKVYKLIPYSSAIDQTEE